MSFDEPTQRMSAERVRHRSDTADPPTTALPGPLNLAGERDATTEDTGSREPSSRGNTDILALDELFDGQASPAAPAAADRPTVDEAPTWTAMPVVPVRSEPVRPPGQGAPAQAGATPMRGQVRTDATAAWEAAVRRTREWLARDDNGLTLMTALVAVILIIAVARLG